MPDVFISYSQDDRDTAKKVVYQLHDAGFSVDWDDTFQIAVGATLSNLIDERLHRATCVLVLWSKSAIDSEWVERETFIGHDRRRLLQVTIDGTRPPFMFRDYIYGSLEYWDGTPKHHEFRRIVDGIHFFQERGTK